MNENGFEILPQAADTRVKVWGKTLEDLFRNALRATAFYLKPEALKLSKKIRQKIKIEAVDINSLLVEFLSGVIAKSDIGNTAFTEVSFKKFGENFLEGVLYGAKVDGFEKEIKAVSYQEADVKRNPETGRYETALVFDA